MRCGTRERRPQNGRTLVWTCQPTRTTLVLATLRALSPALRPTHRSSDRRKATPLRRTTLLRTAVSAALLVSAAAVGLPQATADDAPVTARAAHAPASPALV